MPRCIVCDKAGLFLTVREGLCHECGPRVSADLAALRETASEVERALTGPRAVKLIETRAERVAKLVAACKHVDTYAKRGVKIGIDPQRMAEDLGLELDKEVAKELLGEVSAAAERVALATTPHKVVILIKKLAQRCLDLRDLMYDPTRVAKFIDMVTETLRQAQLDEHLDPASRALRTGDVDKAAVAYKEALYFLSTLPSNEWGATQTAAISSELQRVVAGCPCEYCHHNVRIGAAVCPSCGAATNQGVPPFAGRRAPDLLRALVWDPDATHSTPDTPGTEVLPSTKPDPTPSSPTPAMPTDTSGSGCSAVGCGILLGLGALVVAFVAVVKFC